MTSNYHKDKYLKAWLNYNCTQGNNWIVQYRLAEMISHGNLTYYETTEKAASIKAQTECNLNAADVRHIFFTYMTNDLLITLVETYKGVLYLIHNSMNLIEPDETTNNEIPAKENDKNDDLSIHTVEFKDSMIYSYQEELDNAVIKVNDLPALPKLQSITSKIYMLTNIKHILHCLTGGELKHIGLRKKSWLAMDLKKVQKDEIDKVSFLDLVKMDDETKYLYGFRNYISQSGAILNLTHNYSVTPAILNKLVPSDTPRVKELILSQNFQLDDFSWLKNFPNVRLLNFWYAHRIEQSHIEQIVDTLPEIEVINIHSCCRINIRVLIPILKLRNLQKLAIDDAHFWCQKSIHELFILPHEWKNIYCESLEKVAINSTNLTLDVLDYILTSCPKITQFLVDDNILNMVSRNIIPGRDKEQLTVHSWQHPNKGLQILKRVTFKNLFKDTYSSQLFSESMLKKIKEQRELRNEPEPIPIPHQGKADAKPPMV